MTLAARLAALGLILLLITTLVISLGLTLLFGVPWRGPHREPIKAGELVS